MTDFRVNISAFIPFFLHAISKESFDEKIFLLEIVGLLLHQFSLVLLRSVKARVFTFISRHQKYCSYV